MALGARCGEKQVLVASPVPSCVANGSSSYPPEKVGLAEHRWDPDTQLWHLVQWPAPISPILISALELRSPSGRP